MTKLSKLKLDPSEMAYYVNSLWNAFTLMESKEEVRDFVKDLFTHTEYKMFAKRLEIARRLLEGETYESIRKALNVSDRPINFINNLIANSGKGFKSAHQKLTALEKSYQEKAIERQAYLENRKRRKLPGEKVLPEALEVGIRVLDRTITKRRKRRSVRKNLPM
jgi:uncharacterized protein YerC